MSNNFSSLRVVGPPSEHSVEFLQRMIACMAQSFGKYGAVADAYPGKYDAVASLLVRVAKYLASGNKEFLIDVANFAMIEFMLPRTRNDFDFSNIIEQAHKIGDITLYRGEPFFAHTSTKESPGRVTVHGHVNDDANNGLSQKTLAETAQSPVARQKKRTAAPVPGTSFRRVIEGD